MATQDTGKHKEQKEMTLTAKGKIFVQWLEGELQS